MEEMFPVITYRSLSIVSPALSDRNNNNINSEAWRWVLAVGFSHARQTSLMGNQTPINPTFLHNREMGIGNTVELH